MSVNIISSTISNNGNIGRLIVSIVVSQRTGRRFDTNCGQPLFVSLCQALNLTLPPTAHEYNGYQPSSGVSLRQTSDESRGNIVLSYLWYRSTERSTSGMGLWGLNPNFKKESSSISIMLWNYSVKKHSSLNCDYQWYIIRRLRKIRIRVLLNKAFHTEVDVPIMHY